MTERHRLALAAFAGLALAAALPPLGWWALSPVAILALGAALAGATTAPGLRAGWLAGTVSVAVTGLWIVALVPRFTGLPRALGVGLWLLAAVWMGLGLGVVGAVTGAAGSLLGRPLAAALGVLVADRFGPSVFPDPLAVGLIGAPALPQAADLVGVHGLGAVLLGAAVALVEAATGDRPAGAVAAGTRRARAVAGAWLAAVAVLAVYGAARGGQVARVRAEAPELLVALVQPAVPATLRWDDAMRGPILERLQLLTEEALTRHPDLVVWHEGAYPFPLYFEATPPGAAAPRVLDLAHAPPLLFGAVGVGPDSAIYNATFVREPNGALAAPVAKRVRVPFGEYIPFVAAVPFLRRVFARVEGLHPGTRPELLAAGGHTFGILNCFEDTVARAGAEVAGADLLVNLTNDAWFDGAAPAQHLAQARWRAIEARRDLVRATDDGRTAHIDALGRVVAQAPPHVATVLLVRPRVAIALRPLAPRVIPAAPWAALAVLGAVAAAGVVRRARRRP